MLNHLPNKKQGAFLTYYLLQYLKTNNHYLQEHIFSDPPNTERNSYYPFSQGKKDQNSYKKQQLQGLKAIYFNVIIIVFQLLILSYMYCGFQKGQFLGRLKDGPMSQKMLNPKYLTRELDFLIWVLITHLLYISGFTVFFISFV